MSTRTEDKDMNSPVLKTSARMVDNNSKELNEAVQCKNWRSLESVANIIQFLNSHVWHLKKSQISCSAAKYNIETSVSNSSQS